MGNTIPHGDRLHECTPSCPEGVHDHAKPNLYVRDGDQALPVPNDEESCQARFMARVNTMAPARMELGMARYGTLLQPFNRRDFMQDVFEEMFDAWAYLEGVAAEREAMLALLHDLASWPQKPSDMIVEVGQLQQRAAILLLSMGRSVEVQ